MDIVLHGYWRSTASYRVRIALNLKGLAYSQVTHDLRTGEQGVEAYRALNPQALVPTIQVGGVPITQSPAIFEFLEERFPEPCLLPARANDRAVVRAMTALVCCDIHPLNNLRVLNSLRVDLNASQAQIDSWIERWITDGFAALEVLIARHGGRFAFGDTPTIADCCIVPQAYSANRFGVSLSAFPAIRERVDHCLALPAFIAADPAHQPDAD